MASASDPVSSEDSTGGGSDTSKPNQLEKKIIRQIEFYFGDRNLAKDKFLREKIKEDPEGWVGLDVLLTFNRLKTLSTDESVICGAVRKSSGLVEVNTDGNKIRRVSANGELPSIGLLSPEVRKEMRERTVHVKGFPEDSSLDDIQEFLLQYGETEIIQMRRYTPDHEKARKFKGAVFVEFKDSSSVGKLTESVGLKFKDNELFVETKEQYLKRQNLKRKNRHEKETEDEEPKPKVKKEEEENFIRQKEAVLYFKGCGTDTNREKLKELFNQWSEVAWVDFSIGDTEGYVRFDEEGGARKAFEGITKDGPAQICGKDSSVKVLEGEEESEYWKKMKTDQMRRKQQRKGNFNKKGFKKKNKKEKASDN